MDALDLFGRDWSKAGAFRELLANEAVGVLVQAAFPRVIGLGKIESSFQFLSDALISGELFAIVGSEAKEGIAFDVLHAGRNYLFIQTKRIRPPTIPPKA